jgi:plasmid maintenance system antidote protein VapI
VRGATGAVLVDVVLVDELVTGNTMVTLELLLKLEVVEIIEKLETGTVMLSFELVTTAEELVAEGMVLEEEFEVVVLVDELVTGNTMVTLELLLKLEVVELTGEFGPDTMVLSFELVTTAEELVAEGMVLEDETEVVELTDESVTGRTIFELDELLRLDLVEMTDEFEIGYKTLLERILLLEPEIRLVTISAELVDTPGLADEDVLVDTEEIVDTGSRVEEDADADGLINAEELPDGVETAGLKMTVAKMIPEASRRLDRSN